MLAATRGRANNAPTYLPAIASFVTVHDDYSKAKGCEESASLSTFKQFWKIHHTDKFMKPCEDVCAPCEQHRNQLHSAPSDGDKDLLIEDWLVHISPSKCGHLFYNLGVLSPENRDAVWAALGLNPLKLYITSILVSWGINTSPLICGDNEVNIDWCIWRLPTTPQPWIQLLL